VRWRILTSIVVLTTIAVVLFAAPLAVALGDLHHEEEVVRLERTAAEASEDIPSHFPHTNERLEVRTVHGREIGLYGRGGRLLAGHGPRHADSILRAALRGKVQDRQVGSRIVVAIPLTRAERIVGALRASISDAGVQARNRDAILLMVVIGVLAIGVSALIGLGQSRRLARPVDQLAVAAARLGDGDFTVRPEVSGVPEVDAVSRALGQTAGRLDRLLGRERSFSEDASHQLRTPLTSLRVTLEAARLDPHHDQDAVLETALREVDRLDRTIDDLLTLARELPALDADTDLSAALSTLPNDWQGRDIASGRTIAFSTEPNVPHVTLSARAVRQILDVLIDNALRHGRGTVTIRTRPAGAGAVIEVSDEGPGIVGDADRIFERRVSTAGSHGIGLALARALAEAEGARLVLHHEGPEPIFMLVMSPAGAEGRATEMPS
jgi:signal transduction histidine kinase